MAPIINRTGQPEIILQPDMLEKCDDFFFQNPTFPKDHKYLAQMLTLASLILVRIPVRDENNLVSFLGTTYVPYLIKEQNNNPASPFQLWQHLGLQNSEQRMWCQLLIDHYSTPFHHAFRAHLEENCKFVVKLCGEGIKQGVSFALPVACLFQDLEFELAQVSRTLEIAARERLETAAREEQNGNGKLPHQSDD